jgi:hypothetical protein
MVVQPWRSGSRPVMPGMRPQIVRSPQCQPWASIDAVELRAAARALGLLAGGSATVLVSMRARAEREVWATARLGSSSFSGQQSQDVVLHVSGR